MVSCYDMKFPVLCSGLCWYTESWGGKCSQILATIMLLYNARENKVFTPSHFYLVIHKRSFAFTESEINFVHTPGARFSKLPVITGPVKLFCFLLQKGVSKVLKTIQLSYQLKKQNGLH